MFADQLVAGGEVQDDVGTGQSQTVAGRDGSPHVLTDLTPELHTVGGDEDLRFGSHMHRTASEIDIRRIQVLGRGKPTFLVELTVVRQIGLRHDTEQCTTLDDGGTVVEQAVDHHRQSEHRDDVELAGEVEQ